MLLGGLDMHGFPSCKHHRFRRIEVLVTWDIANSQFVLFGTIFLKVGKVGNL